MKVPLGAQLEEIDREIALRLRVYPRWVAAGKITQSQADHRMEVIRAVRETIAEASKGEELFR